MGGEATAAEDAETTGLEVPEELVAVTMTSNVSPICEIAGV
jgi:hypothetical protein